MAEHQYLSFGNSGVNSQGSSDCESSCLSRAILALGFQVLEHVGLRLFSDVRDSNTLNFGGLGEAEAVGDSLLNFFRDGNGLVVPTLLVVDESTVESLLDNAVLRYLNDFLSFLTAVLQDGVLLYLLSLSYLFSSFDHY